MINTNHTRDITSYTQLCPQPVYNFLLIKIINNSYLIYQKNKRYSRSYPQKVDIVSKIINKFIQ